MENYARTLELVETAEESAGRSEEQFAKYQDTMEYKLKQLKNTWEQFRKSFADQDAFKTALDLVNKTLERIQTVDLSQIVAAISLVSTLGVTGLSGTLKGVQSLTTSVTNAISSGINAGFDAAVGSIGSFTKPFEEKIKEALIRAVNSGEVKAQYSNKAFNGLSAQNRVAKNDKIIFLQNTQQKAEQKAIEAQNKVNVANNVVTTLTAKNKNLQQRISENEKYNSFDENNIKYNEAKILASKGLQPEMYTGGPGRWKDYFQDTGQMRAATQQISNYYSSNLDRIGQEYARLTGNDINRMITLSSKYSSDLTKEEKEELKRLTKKEAENKGSAELRRSYASQNKEYNRFYSEAQHAIDEDTKRQKEEYKKELKESIAKRKEAKKIIKQEEEYRKNLEKENEVIKNRMRVRQEVTEQDKAQLKANEEAIEKSKKTSETYQRVYDSAKNRSESYAAKLNNELSGLSDAERQALLNGNTGTTSIFGRAKNKVGNYLRNNINANLLTEDENGKTQIENLTSQAKSAISNGITFGLTTAITTALMGGDMETAIKAGLTSLFMGAFPQLLSVFINITTGILGGPAVAVAMAAALTGTLIYALVKASNEAEQVELKRLKNINKTQSELEKEQISGINNIKKAIKEKNDFEEKTIRLNELQNKSFLTSDEEEELSALATAINSSYPEIVESFNENTNEIKINSEKLNELNDTLNKNKQNKTNELISEISGEQINVENTKNKVIEFLEKMNYQGYLNDDRGNFFEQIRYIMGEDFNKVFTEAWMSDINQENADELLKSNGYNYNYFTGGDSETENKIQQLIKATTEYYDGIINDLEISKTKSYLQSQDEISDITSKALSLIVEPIDGFTANKEKMMSNSDTTTSSAFRDSLRNGKIEKASQIAGVDSSILEAALENMGYKKIGDNDYNSYIDLFQGINSELIDYDNLTPEFKEKLGNFGYDKSNFKQNNLTAFTDVLYAEMESLYNIENLKKDNDDNLNKYKQLSKIIEDYEDKTEEQYETAIKEFAEKNDIDGDKLIENLLSDENSYSSKFKEMKNELSSIGIEISQLTYESLSSVLANFKDGNYSSYVTKEWGSMYEEMTKNLSSDAASIIASVDLKSDYSTLLSKTNEYAEALAETGMDTEEAAKLYLDYITRASKIVGNVIYTKEGLDVFTNTMSQNYEANTSKYETLIEAQKKMNKDGSLDQNMIDKLDKAGLNSAHTVSDGKYVLTDDAYDLYGSSQYNVYAAYKNSIEINKDKLKKYSTITKTKQQKDQLETAKEIYDRDKSFKNAPFYVTEQMQELAIAASTAEMSVEEYIQSMEEVTQLAEEGIGEQQVIYFNQLALGYMEAKEQLADYEDKLEEYQEELEDLNETLVDHEKALTKAKEKLEEAYHGSKNLQSGLNEFQAFDEKLTDIDTKLSEVNDDLQDFNELSNTSANIQSKLALESEQAAIKIAKGLSAQEEVAKAQAQLSSDFGATFDENGRANLNLDYLTLDANDEMRKKYEELVNYLNTNIEVAQENDKDKILKELERSRREELKKHYETIAKLDDSNIKVLQENAKEEVEETKKKYDALKEADNDYLEALEDAINKQRKLREMEKDDEDLAKQEKKLSLMKRDTSGANQVELAKLEEEVQDKRENSFDKKVDNVLDNLKELYKKEEELKEEELNALEAVTEDVQYFAEAWQQIRNSFTSADDYVAWRLENDKDLEDLTPEQTQAKIYELQDEYNNFVVAQTSITEGLKVDQEDLLIKANEAYDNINNLSVNYIENLNALTEKTVAEAIDDAEEAVRSAQKSYDDTIEKINDLNKKIVETESNIAGVADSATKSYESFVENAKKLEEEATASGQAALIRIVASMNGIDVATESGWSDTMQKMKDAGFQLSSDYYYSIKESILGTNSVDALAIGITEMSKQVLKEKGKNANGGLVDYTGLAWVDGSTTRPEAFLSAEDTARIGAAAQLLSNIDFLTNGNLNTNSISSNVGDTSIEIHINVDKLSSDYDVDNLVERIKKDIVNVSKPVGSSVILAK